MLAMQVHHEEVARRCWSVTAARLEPKYVAVRRRVAPALRDGQHMPGKRLRRRIEQLSTHARDVAWTGLGEFERAAVAIGSDRSAAMWHVAATVFKTEVAQLVRSQAEAFLSEARSTGARSSERESAWAESFLPGDRKRPARHRSSDIVAESDGVV